MTVSVKGHTYEMGRKEFNNMIKTLKKSLKKQPMIIAIENNGHAELRNDAFSTQKALTDAVCRWNKMGFKVHYTRGI